MQKAVVKPEARQKEDRGEVFDFKTVSDDNQRHKRDGNHAKSLVPAHDARAIAHTKAQNKACDSDEGECCEGEKIKK